MIIAALLPVLRDTLSDSSVAEQRKKVVDSTWSECPCSKRKEAKEEGRCSLYGVSSKYLFYLHHYSFIVRV